jgi:hypothetical protein
MLSWKGCVLDDRGELNRKSSKGSIVNRTWIGYDSRWSFCLGRVWMIRFFVRKSLKRFYELVSNVPVRNERLIRGE